MKTHLKTAWDYIRRSPFQSIAVVFVLSLTFFVATLVSTVVYSSSRLLSYFETRPQVIAFLKSDSSDSDITNLKQNLEADSYVKDVRYVSKEDALSIYKKSTSDNPLLGELVDPTIFPASLEFSVTDLSYAQDVIEKLKNENVVDSVGFTAALGGEASLNEVINRLKTVTNYVRIGGSFFVGLLMAVSLVVLLVITSIRVIGRRDEMEILNLIGASKGFIRSPIVLESFIYTLSGVILGWSLAFIAVLYLAPSLLSYFGEIPILPKDTVGLLEVFGTIFGAEVVGGSILALIGSLLGISRVKKVR